MDSLELIWRLLGIYSSELILLLLAALCQPVSTTEEDILACRSYLAELSVAAQRITFSRLAAEEEEEF